MIARAGVLGITGLEPCCKSVAEIITHGDGTLRSEEVLQSIAQLIPVCLELSFSVSAPPIVVVGPGVLILREEHAALCRNGESFEIPFPCTSLAFLCFLSRNGNCTESNHDDAKK